MINKPATAADPTHKHSAYQDMHDQWSAMPPPDPATLLKLIFSPGFLTQHQIEAIKALMSAPGTPATGSTAAPAPAMPSGPGPMGGPAR